MKRCSFFMQIPLLRARNNSFKKKCGAAVIYAINTLALTLFISTSTASPSITREFESITDLQDHLQQYMEAFFLNRYPNLVLGDTLVVNTGSLDRRLQLRKCAEVPELHVKAPPQNSTNVTVKTSCTAGNRWTIYVPVKVETFQNVVVAAHSIIRGSVLRAEDLMFQRINTAAMMGAHVTDLDRVVGMEVKRPLRQMDVVKLNQLKQPDVINKGETVVLRVKTAILSVETEGTALTNGHMGEKIKVRNESSRRIVDGLVTGPGEVRVASW